MTTVLISLPGQPTIQRELPELQPLHRVLSALGVQGPVQVEHRGRALDLQLSLAAQRVEAGAHLVVGPRARPRLQHPGRPATRSLRRVLVGLGIAVLGVVTTAALVHEPAPTVDEIAAATWLVTHESHVVAGEDLVVTTRSLVDGSAYEEGLDELRNANLGFFARIPDDTLRQEHAWGIQVAQFVLAQDGVRPEVRLFAPRTARGHHPTPATLQWAPMVDPALPDGLVVLPAGAEEPADAVLHHAWGALHPDRGVDVAVDPGTTSDDAAKLANWREVSVVQLPEGALGDRPRVALSRGLPEDGDRCTVFGFDPAASDAPALEVDRVDCILREDAAGFVVAPTELALGFTGGAVYVEDLGVVGIVGPPGEASPAPRLIPAADLRAALQGAS